MQRILPRLVFIIFFCAFWSCKKAEITSSVADSSSPLAFYPGNGLEYVYSVEKTKDGGLIYAGKTQDLNTKGTDAFLMKVDANGNRQWFKTYGKEGDDALSHVIELSVGGFLAVGNSSSYEPGHILKDGYMVKTDAMGNMIWQHGYGLDYNDYLNFVIEMPDHSYTAVGSLTRFEPDLFVININDTGGINQGYTYKLGPYWDFGMAATLSPEGNIMVAALTSISGVAIEIRKFHTTLVSINPTDFSKNWQVTYSDFVRSNCLFGSLDRYNDLRILPTPDGYLLGTFLPTDGKTSSVQLLKTNLDGSMAWQRQYSGLSSAMLSNLIPTQDGGYLICGGSNTTGLKPEYWGGVKDMKAMLMKVDKDGNEQWASYTGSNTNASLALFANQIGGGYAVGGYTTFTENGSRKIFRYITDVNGKLIDVKK